MDVGRYLVEAHLKEGRSVASLARDHGLHRSWIYKLLARYGREGEAGLAPRSRRPRTSPTAEPRARGANRRDPQRALRRRPRLRFRDDPGLLGTRGADTAVGQFDLAGAEATRVHHAPTPEATEVLLPTLRGVTAQ